MRPTLSTDARSDQTLRINRAVQRDVRYPRTAHRPILRGTEACSPFAGTRHARPSPEAGPLGCTIRKYPVRFDAFPLSDVFDDFDEFVDAVAVVTGEGDELPRALDNGAQLRCAGDRDAAPAAELEKSLVAEHP